nr:hypothetical protein [Tanacetum cinerariifolium]
MASNPENVRLGILAKLQEALDEEDILADQILTMMHRYADRFTNRKDEINNFMVLQDHPLVDYESQHTMLIGVNVQGEWHHFGAEQKRKLKISNGCPSFGAFIFKKICIHSANSLIHTQPTSMSKVPVIDVNSSNVHECDNQCNLHTPMSVRVPVSPCINNDNETMLRSTNIQMEYVSKDTSKGILGTTDLSNSCDNRLTQGLAACNELQSRADVKDAILTANSNPQLRYKLNM